MWNDMITHMGSDGPMGWGIGGVGFGLHWVGMLLFWGLLAVAVYFVIRALVAGGGSARDDDALEILRRRYASGEIDKQEYEEKKSTLTR